MNEIICPNCKKAFKVDEAGFADILKQVRDHQFEEELNNRLALAAILHLVTTVSVFILTIIARSSLTWWKRKL